MVTVNLRGLARRIDRLKQLQPAEGRPVVVCCLPDNGHYAYAPGPWPRVQPSGNATIVVYRPKDGQPSGADIAELLKGAA